VKAQVAAAVLMAAVLTAPQPAAARGDPARGEAVYARCLACHALAYHRTGPKHCGLFGRRAGRAPGFHYSPAMAQADFVWDEETLDRFLRDPTGTVPGTSMGYAGIADGQERADLIAWLRQASASSRQCPVELP
jgi:cytochrome c